MWACRKKMYDVVLMDLRMPVMDGFHVTSEIRKINESIEKPRIIGISARASEEDVNAAFESGSVGKSDETLSRGLKAKEACCGVS
jgi:CheY-like chemotaxis protein